MMIKKIKTLVVILAIVSLWSCDQEEDPVFTESDFYGEWTNDLGTIYYCSEGTFIMTYGSAGTWNVSNNNLFLSFPTGREDIYRILDVSATSYKIKSQSTEDTWSAVKQSDDGCYVPEGQVMIWSSEYLGCSEVDVYIDNVYEGSLTKYYSPDEVYCGIDGCVTVSMAPGTYDFRASCSNGSWSSDFTIYDGQCSKIKLTAKKKKAKI